MIEILLAAYNGERWLGELLESLAYQVDQRFTILAKLISTPGFSGSPCKEYFHLWSRL